MKKIILSSFLILSTLLAAHTICRAQKIETIPLYRLRFELRTSGDGGNQSEHFYTANKAERDSALNNLKDFLVTGGGFLSLGDVTEFKFIDEGVEGYISPDQAAGTVPLYRLYKPGPKHFYTADAKEKSKAIKLYGYKLENIVGYLSPVQIPGTTPLYRLYKAAKGKTRDDHFYTIKEDEKYGALHKYGYADEGIAGYVWTSALTPSVRIRKP